jgi:thiamine biosynthesis protein ThiS
MTATPAASARMMLRVNGETRDVPTGWTVQTLLDDLHLDPRLVVVELNREILRDRSALPVVPLRDGDVLELVHFVGGG